MPDVGRGFDNRLSHRLSIDGPYCATFSMPDGRASIPVERKKVQMTSAILAATTSWMH
jgi:hypothetical protein